MAQRNAAYARMCTGCDTQFRCTAKELARRINACKGSLGSIFLPDCGLAPNVKRVLSAISGHVEAVSGSRGNDSATLVS